MTNTRRAAHPLATLALGALLLCGCSTSSQPLPAPATPLATEAPSDHGTVTPAPEAPAESQTDAEAAAVKVMEAFAQTSLSADAWLSNLYPLLSQAGAEAHSGTDPSRIPVHQVTGAGATLPGSTDVALIVSIPTDVGDYFVSLSRTTPEGPWLADRIRPAP